MKPAAAPTQSLFHNRSREKHKGVHKYINFCVMITA